ncbi:MAG: SDR family oxidoreductase [Bacteroidia bacterium]|nr:SDR family oxidoreductase [Bacteroidia bacterium]
MKKAFVTGITKGIGKAIALALLQAGYEVSGCARQGTAFQAFQTENPNCILYPVDLADSSARQKFCTSLKELPAFDIWINNVGIFFSGEFWKESATDFGKQWQLNVVTPYELTQAVLPAMITRKQGTILNIVSIAAREILPNCVGYTTTKFALDGFTRSLREELRPHQIRVIGVYPASTQTESWGDSSFPNGRLLNPNEIAKMIVSALSLPEYAVTEEIQIRSIFGNLP